MTEKLIIKSDFKRFDAWTEAFAPFDVDIVDWESDHDPDEFTYALVWKPEPGALAQYRNLKVIFSVGAGLDHLKPAGVLPEGVPVVRMVEPGLTAGMVEYVLYQVLRFHRFMPEYAAQQREGVWEGIIQLPAAERTVGILGVGELGTACAKALEQIGFQLCGWSRTPKSIPGVDCFHGRDQLSEMLARSEILVCLLPLTEETSGILNLETFNHMPRGACVINVGRGGCQVDGDILAALDSGQLRGAALDVFEQEPLPRDSGMWAHPGVTITPHVASMTLPSSCAEAVYENIQRCRRGQPLLHLADMSRGY